MTARDPSLALRMTGVRFRGNSRKVAALSRRYSSTGADPSANSGLALKVAATAIDGETPPLQH
jgi:hypothetical protein